MVTETVVDLHVKILNERVIERARSSGLDVIVYAPHFQRLPEIQATARSYTTDDLLVVPGREVFTGTWRNRKHVLAIGLSDPVPDFITLESAMAEFYRQDAAVLVPHPEFTTVSLDAIDIRTYRETIDSIEIFNPKHLPSHNRRATELATDFEIQPFTSSYAHLSGTVGICETVFETTIDSERTLVDALVDDVDRRIFHRTGVDRFRTTAMELAHLCYENSWKKIDRLFLSGTEPTHPHHIAYDGRFDDVCVY